MKGIKLTDEEKKQIYADLKEGESVKSLCLRHNISSHVIYSWLKRSRGAEALNSKALQPLQVIGTGNEYFATVNIGYKQICFGQSVPASYINELR
jgi:hypothetical protein